MLLRELTPKNHFVRRCRRRRHFGSLLPSLSARGNLSALILRRGSHIHVNIMECYIINYNYNFSYLGLFTVNAMEMRASEYERFRLRFTQNTNVSLYGIRMIGRKMLYREHNEKR